MKSIGICRSRFLFFIIVFIVFIFIFIEISLSEEEDATNRYVLHAPARVVCRWAMPPATKGKTNANLKEPPNPARPVDTVDV